MNNSRTLVANKQKNSNYRPSGQIAAHVENETRFIKSTSPVLHSKDGYYIASKKFTGRYYLVTVDNGIWNCSASDERVAQNCITIAQEYEKVHTPVVVEQKAAVQEVEAIVQQALQEEVKIVVEDPAIEALIVAMKPTYVEDSTDPFINDALRSTPVRDGYYTVSLPDDKHRTFRLRTQEFSASFAPGKQVIGFLSGSNNEHDYVNFAFVVNGELHCWKKFQSGYEAVKNAAQYLLSGHSDEAGKMYAQESGNCYICNRTLTTPESITNGIGPVCARKAA